MNPDLLLAHFDRMSQAPDAMPRLRRFILDLAVRGKLVEQDPKDEPASELLKRIRTEKERLAKAHGSKQDAFPTIERGEPPFDIPCSWTWIRVGCGFEYDAGIKREPRELVPDRWLLELEDIEKDTSVVHTRLKAKDRDSRSTKSEFKAGDILYGKLRPYLNKVVVADEEGYSTTEIVAIRPFIPMSSSYCCLAFRRPDFVEYVSRAGRGTKMPRLRTQDALVALFPLPPLAEQHRIVAKVDELMALCDRLEVAQAEREKRRDLLTRASHQQLTTAADADTLRSHTQFFLSHLPHLTARPDQIKQLRQSILDLAVRGQLVSQDSTDEPAAQLVQRIKMTEGTSRAKAKFAMKPTLPPLDTTREPFELPSGWTWVRFPELGFFGRGKSKHRPRNDQSLFEGGTHLLVQTGDVVRSNGVIKTFTNRYNDVGLAQSAKWPKGTLCITIAANIADSGILSFDACFPDSVVGFIPSALFPNARYFEYFIRTAKADLLEFAPATAQKNINLEILNAVLIPLSPLAEQHRIVARVDELMALCDQLENSLSATQVESLRLLEAVLCHALGDSRAVIEPLSAA